MSDLETRFHRAMVNIYQEAKRVCNYNATYFLRMITDYGGLEAAKRLLAKETVSDGLGTLKLCGRLDLSVEAHVIKPEFSFLFSDEELTVARQRLLDYGFEPDKRW